VIAARDTDAPVTTATTNPANPNGTRPVTVTLSATDGTGLGVERTEYRVNGGPWQEYTVPFRRSEPGAYVVEYRSIDRASNTEQAKRLEFTIAVLKNCNPDLNDEFDGTALDTQRWAFAGNRRDDTAISVAEGQLALKIRAGDLIGATASAKNVLLQDAPDGPFMVTTRLNVRDLTEEGQQAGLVLWNGESPNTFAKIVYINKGATRRFEYVATRGNASDIRPGTDFATAPREAYLRVRADGVGRYIAESSLDGERWERIAIPLTNMGDPKTMKIGIKVSDNADSEAAARFLYFRVDCSDRIAPESSATVTPARPDGELGWYETPPTVTLTANDGPPDNIGKIEYRIDDGPVRTYTGPFEVTEDGDHVIRYFATDKAAEPNTEDAKTLGVRVDRTAPTTDLSLHRPQGNDGPVSVTVTPQDGAGSGAVLTQYRVDSGPWRTYASKDEQIFDGTPASLGQWVQAAEGGFELLGDGSGGISPTPSQSLGMLWYPVKQFGDFRLKLEFREGRTDGGHSNGGVFVRFPDPRIPLADRKDQCARTGAAQTNQAWVAVFCGHEIQLYDGQGGEHRKTGSVYTFDNNTIDQIGDPRPLGEWNDYEIEVRGQSYRIFRNGKLINEYENSPDKTSDRGDPSAALRQFAQGYIGLQNHGGPDRMQYRNVRVEDLSPDAPGRNPTGPFTVSGRGPHTIEVRSVDAAGHVEEKKAVDFEIGATTAPGSTTPAGQTPPVLDVPPMTDTPASHRLGDLPARVGAKRLARRGITVPVTCTGAMSGSAKLTVSRATARKLKLGRRTLDTSSVRCWGEHTAKVTLKPSKALARRLNAWRKSGSGPRSVTLRISVRMADAGKAPETSGGTLTLRR
jgi:hypothetical protein